MWVYVPQRWWEVPGWLVRGWLGAAAEGRRERARRTETPPRVTATPRRGRLPLGPTIEQIRLQVRKVRPKECCVKQPMVAGGKRTTVCSNDCPWQELDKLIAIASIDAEE